MASSPGAGPLPSTNAFAAAAIVFHGPLTFHVFVFNGTGPKLDHSQVPIDQVELITTIHLEDHAVGVTGIEDPDPVAAEQVIQLDPVLLAVGAAAETFIADSTCSRSAGHAPASGWFWALIDLSGEPGSVVCAARCLPSSGWRGPGESSAGRTRPSRQHHQQPCQVLCGRLHGGQLSFQLLPESDLLRQFGIIRGITEERLPGGLA